MGKLTIIRKKEFLDFTYIYKVVIDGVEIAEISSGQTIKVDIADNKEHSIFVKRNFFSSPKIKFQIENQTTLEVGNFRYSRYFIFFLFWTILSNFLTRKTDYHNYTTILNSLVFVVLLIFILFRRKKYLQITELSRV